MNFINNVLITSVVDKIWGLKEENCVENSMKRIL